MVTVNSFIVVLLIALYHFQQLRLHLKKYLCNTIQYLYCNLYYLSLYNLYHVCIFIHSFVFIL